jgi:hypothetical protein
MAYGVEHTPNFITELATCLPRIVLSRQQDLNQRPTVYKTVALPLSYAGMMAGLAQNSYSTTELHRQIYETTM